MEAPTAARAWSWFVTSPADPATDAVRRSIDLVGLRLPVRASAAVAATTLLLLVAFSRILLPASVQATSSAA